MGTTRNTYFKIFSIYEENDKSINIFSEEKMPKKRKNKS